MYELLNRINVQRIVGSHNGIYDISYVSEKGIVLRGGGPFPLFYLLSPTGKILDTINTEQSNELIKMMYDQDYKKYEKIIVISKRDSIVGIVDLINFKFIKLPFEKKYYQYIEYTRINGKIYCIRTSTKRKKITEVFEIESYDPEVDYSIKNFKYPLVKNSWLQIAGRLMIFSHNSILKIVDLLKKSVIDYEYHTPIYSILRSGDRIYIKNSQDNKQVYYFKMDNNGDYSKHEVTESMMMFSNRNQLLKHSDHLMMYSKYVDGIAEEGVIDTANNININCIGNDYYKKLRGITNEATQFYTDFDHTIILSDSHICRCIVIKLDEHFIEEFNYPDMRFADCSIFLYGKHLYRLIMNRKTHAKFMEIIKI